MAQWSDLDKLLQSFVDGGLPGCSCAVAQNGKVLYEGTAGMADREAGRPVEADTVFRIYSMSKLITCTAVLMLLERGKLLLNDPLYAYLPEYRDHSVVRRNPAGYEWLEKAKQPILIRHAMSMTMGLPYEDHPSRTGEAIRRVNRSFEHREDADIVQYARALAKVPMAFEAGSHYLYGLCHDVLGALVQVVSGKTFGQFLQDELFGPLGMDSTAFRLRGNMEQRLTAMVHWSESDGSQTAERGPDRVHMPMAVCESGGGGLFSTLGDYLAFTQMLACGGVHGGKRIISSRTIDLMRENQLGEEQLGDFRSSYLSGYGYGLGVRTMMEPGKANVTARRGEFGWSGMAGTYTSIDPSDGTSIVYMHQILPNRDEYYNLRAHNLVSACLG